MDWQLVASYFPVKFTDIFYSVFILNYFHLFDSESKLNLSQLLDTVLSMEKSHQREPSNNDSNKYPSTNETKAQGGIQRKTHVGKVDSRQKHSITGFDSAISIGKL